MEKVLIALMKKVTADQIIIGLKVKMNLNQSERMTLHSAKIKVMRLIGEKTALMRMIKT